MKKSTLTLRPNDASSKSFYGKLSDHVLYVTPSQQPGIYSVAVLRTFGVGSRNAIPVHRAFVPTEEINAAIERFFRKRSVEVQIEYEFGVVVESA